MDIIDELEHVKSTQNIARTIGRHDDPRYGCWIESPTAVSDIHIGSKNWLTYSRPVFAYLEPRAYTSLPAGVKRTIQTSYTEGFTRETTLSIGVEFSIPGLSQLNITTGLKLGYEEKLSSTESNTVTMTSEISEMGSFQPYNLIIVYAHNTTSAARELSGHFRHHRQNFISRDRIDLTFLTAVGTNHLVFAQDDKILAESFTFDRVQREILERYDAHQNKGAFEFDYKTTTLI